MAPTYKVKPSLERFRTIYDQKRRLYPQGPKPACGILGYLPRSSLCDGGIMHYLHSNNACPRSQISSQGAGSALDCSEPSQNQEIIPTLWWSGCLKDQAVLTRHVHVDIPPTRGLSMRSGPTGLAIFVSGKVCIPCLWNSIAVGLDLNVSLCGVDDLSAIGTKRSTSADWSRWQATKSVTLPYGRTRRFCEVAQQSKIPFRTLCRLQPCTLSLHISRTIFLLCTKFPPTVGSHLRRKVNRGILYCSLYLYTVSLRFECDGKALCIALDYCVDCHLMHPGHFPS
ncbi:hypothetical protein HBI56_174370 [Parastagonospora nodorum]|nr:hypothetical protein HBH51_236760 [Parastagonospora nodorum]KAH3993458.1 hypothetical protein HBI10_201650 [Parastagonospora nodorum]KAH4011767.1 hypothetical protein HBI13_196600 [Parastagonospora nodorum]KAH4024805.1 hypothetical protein HBI09_158690 [Parastagonospora nodorum]KAH4046104.1 hypothetical protein HBH49_193490 [Parastagonospora nodorum]